MTSKLLEWLRRYLPMEICGTVSAFFFAWMTYELTDGNMIASAVAGTWGENLGFYGYGGTREVLHYRKIHKKDVGIRKYFRIFFKTIRNILMEFGSSEALDSFLLRPALMYFFQTMFGFSVGILAGKFAADIVFYSIAIIGYEMRKKLFKD